MNEVRFVQWNGMDALSVSNDLSDLILTLQGAHVVSFIPKGSKDLIWVSEKSYFADGKPIRGGIPVCWPWFGKAAEPGHGIARIHRWTPESFSTLPGGETKVELSYTPDCAEFSFLTVRLAVTAGKSLKLELTTSNRGTAPFVLGEAFHTYFSIGGIRTVKVLGLDGAEYLDNTDHLKVVKQSGDVVFTAETDRVYTSDKTSVIHDPVFGRKIRIEKSGSNNTVVWNPWIDKSIAMPDYGDQEYPGMVCVETANAFGGRVTLDPGKSHTMTAVISEEVISKV